MSEYEDDIAIAQYIDLVLQYLDIEECIERCSTPNEFKHMAEKAELYLTDEDIAKLSLSELREFIKLDFRNHIKNVTYAYMAKLEQE